MSTSTSSSTSSPEQTRRQRIQDPWEIEDEMLANQCIDSAGGNENMLWKQHTSKSLSRKARTISDIGLLVAMFLCMSSAMLRIKSR